MIQKSKNQSSLFPVDNLEMEPVSSTRITSELRLSLVLDHREWLLLLANDWSELQQSQSYLALGVHEPLAVPGESNRIAVTAWLNVDSLPRLSVQIRRGTEWRHATIDQLTSLDQEVAWPGPIPLFCVREFSVPSNDAVVRILSMSRGFSNLSQDIPPIRVAPHSTQPAAPKAPTPPVSLRPPVDWNARRGAAAMAVWAVPAVEPWIKVLSNSLSIDPDKLIAEKMGAPWLNTPPWRSPTEKFDQFGDLPLWQSILEVFRITDYRHGWNPGLVFDRIIGRLSPTHSREFDDFAFETRQILSDKRAINSERGISDPLGMALQLVLLRPMPERYITWSNELSAMPPVVWWTGAALAGFLCGFRDLETRFSGTSAGRKLLALRTWTHGSSELEPSWHDASLKTEISWRVEDGFVRLQCDGIVWAERKESNRGKWYMADLANPETRNAAIAISSQLNPSALRSTLRMRDVNLPYSGDGSIGLGINERQIIITDDVEIEMPEGFQVSVNLRDEVFREWLVKGSIADRLPLPPHINVATVYTDTMKPERASLIPGSNLSNLADIPGLWEVPHFLSGEQEQRLVDVIENSEWLPTLSRRVQHYGWKYDYKKGKVDLTERIGPLPEWAMEIANELLLAGLVPELPDQVIVNEYVGKQGIAPHVDCPTCFVGPIVTISLLESWEMIFRDESGRSVTRTLERGSAFILGGDARNLWSHEIPKRVHEPWGRRGRRISLTFRKVAISEPVGRKRSKQKILPAERIQSDA